MDIVSNLLLQLRQAYLSELPERADELEMLILEIKNAGLNADRFNDLYRRIHSLKGSGGTHGAHIITAICHSFEDFLTSINQQTSLQSTAHIDIALNFVDLLRNAALRLKNNSDDFGDIEVTLNELRQKAFTPRYSALVVVHGGAIISIVGQVLKNHGCRMVLMKDGFHALGRALVEPFDMVITSLELPGLNGSAMISALKLADCHNKYSRCILLTANDNLPLTIPTHDFILLKNSSLLPELNKLIQSIIQEHESSGKLSNGLR